MIHDIVLYGGCGAIGMLLAALPLLWSRLSDGQ